MAYKSTKYCDIHQACTCVEWCSLCEQALCLKCKEFHSQAKVTKNHTTISIDDFLRLPAFVKSIKRICDDHEDKLNFYCPLHEAVCCFYCIQSTHKQCDGVAQLLEVAENVNLVTSMENLERNIRELTLGMEKVLQDRKQNISNLDKQKSLTLLKIKECKQDIMRYLDELEKQIADDLNNKVLAGRSQIDKLRSKITSKKVEMGRIADKLNVIKQFTCNTDTFIVLQTLTKEVKTADQYLLSLETETAFSNTEVSYVKLECINMLQQHVPSLGCIIVKSNPNSMKFRQPINNKEADFPEALNCALRKIDDHSKKNITTQQQIHHTDKTKKISANLRDNQTIDIRSQVKLVSLLRSGTRNAQITACKMLPCDEYVLSEWQNKRVFILHKDGTLKNAISLPESAFDFAYINKYVFAVSLKFSVSVIDFDNSKVVLNFRLPHECRGLAVGNGNIYVSLKSIQTIEVLEINSGVKTGTITSPFNAIYMEYCKEKLFCSNFHENNVFCISLNGQLLWNYRSEIMTEPFCVKSDSRGVLYVSCRKQNNVIAVNFDGENGYLLFDGDQGFKKPRAIDFCDNTGKLCVCEEQNGSLFIYDIK